MTLPRSSPAPSDPRLAADRAEAIALFKQGRDGRYVADWLGRPLGQVADWRYEWRNAAGRQAA